jgi:hypothetical protein
MIREKVDPDTRIDLYLAAWRAANNASEHEQPIVSYENGWFCFRYSPEEKPCRCRATAFEEMHLQLVERARQ